MTPSLPSFLRPSPKVAIQSFALQQTNALLPQLILCRPEPVLLNQMYRCWIAMAFLQKGVSPYHMRPYAWVGARTVSPAKIGAIACISSSSSQ
jgi:hypothetical protein